MQKTTDELLVEIVSYQYKCYGFPFVFLDYSQSDKKWSITWRNPAEFSNNHETDADTPNESCVKALQFIKNNRNYFTKIAYNGKKETTKTP